ncbi:hypothetical protein FBU31_003286 [Coemansia sp. 'formosensis']|nr:hypothetical protein FBU31_003286 [Coemansia sp. 'formosensis']
MRVEGADNSSSSQRMWGPGRPRLSFGEHSPSHRRRVFAHLAPQEADEQPTVDQHPNSNDHDETSFVVVARPLASPPTPPRRRSWGGADSSDEDPGEEQPADAGEDQVRLALERFGQLRRQRFMRDQHTRPVGTAALEGQSAGGDAVSMQQHFPSNDVDSYWYNQASPADVAPVAVLVPVHRVNRLQMQRYQLPPPPPPVSRNHLEEESRRAALEALRASGSAAPEAGDEDDYFERQQLLRRRRRPLYDRGPDKNGAAADGGSGGGCMSAGRNRQPTVAWLTKHSVVARSLDCSLLQAGMKYVGVQKSLDHAAMAKHRGAGWDMALGRDQWDVEVDMQWVDMRAGRLAGVMRAINVRNMPAAVVTTWEGEVVDFKNFAPLTGKWRASPDHDAQYWRLFASLPAADESTDAFLCKWPTALCGARMPCVLEDYIYMRWKGKKSPKITRICTK